MWYETHFTIPINIFKNVIKKWKGIATYQSSQIITMENIIDKFSVLLSLS